MSMFNLGRQNRERLLGNVVTDIGKKKSKTRGKIFKAEELYDLVKMLDEYSDVQHPPGEINRKKKELLETVASHLNAKFKVSHTGKQVNKRFADLKMREHKKLAAIRRQIFEDNEAKVKDTPTPCMDDVSSEAMSVNIAPRDRIDTSQECMTIELEPIQHDSSVMFPSGKALPLDNSSMLEFFGKALATMEANLGHKMEQLTSQLEKKLHLRLDIIQHKLSCLEEKMLMLPC